MLKTVGNFFPFSIKLSENSVSWYLFLKRHEGTCTSKPSDRTVFCVNIPQYFTEKNLRHLFEEYGEIQSVYLHKKPTASEEKIDAPTSSYFSKESSLGSKVGYIVFKNGKSVEKVFKSKKTHVLKCKEEFLKTGKSKWINEYNSSFVDVKGLQEEINNFMSNYDEKVEEEKRKEKEALEMPDEEGWTTISKHSKKPKIPRKETASTRILERQKKQMAKKTLTTFYKSQLRDAKVTEILELRERFEKDKARIVQMKANRKFKPF